MVQGELAEVGVVGTRKGGANGWCEERVSQVGVVGQKDGAIQLGV